jgi:hypothetical protein
VRTQGHFAETPPRSYPTEDCHQVSVAAAGKLSRRRPNVLTGAPVILAGRLDTRACRLPWLAGAVVSEVD